MRKVAGCFLALVMFIVSVTFITSCAKNEDPEEEYYMRFKANGKLIEYTNQLRLSAGISQSGNQYVWTISGWNDASSNFSFLLFYLASITENSYSG